MKQGVVFITSGCGLQYLKAEPAEAGHMLRLLCCAWATFKGSQVRLGLGAKVMGTTVGGLDG